MDELGDYISRKAVLEHYRVTDPQGTFAYCSSILEFVESLPAAEPERKSGRWDCADDMFEHAVCSVCKFDSGEGWEYAKKWFKFCPNCGAKMEVENE